MVQEETSRKRYISVNQACVADCSIRKTKWVDDLVLQDLQVDEMQSVLVAIDSFGKCFRHWKGQKRRNVTKCEQMILWSGGPFEVLKDFKQASILSFKLTCALENECADAVDKNDP